MDLEEVQVASYLRSHPDFLEEWLSRNADHALREAVRKKWAASEDRGSLDVPLAVATVTKREIRNDASTVVVQPYKETEAPSAKCPEDTADDNDQQSDEAVSSGVAFSPEVGGAGETDQQAEDPEDDTLSSEPSPSVVPRTGRKSVTSDLFHQWLASGSSSAPTGTSGIGGGGNAEGRLRLGKLKTLAMQFPLLFWHANAFASSSCTRVRCIAYQEYVAPKNPSSFVLASSFLVT